VSLCLSLLWQKLSQGAQLPGNRPRERIETRSCHVREDASTERSSLGQRGRGEAGRDRARRRCVVSPRVFTTEQSRTQHTRGTLSCVSSCRPCAGSGLAQGRLRGFSRVRAEGALYTLNPKP